MVYFSVTFRWNGSHVYSNETFSSGRGGDVVHRTTRGIGEGHYLFIYYGLSPYSGNPVTRVVRALLAANLAPPTAYH